MSTTLHEVPSEDICGLQTLKLSLVIIKALHSGKESLTGPERDELDSSGVRAAPEDMAEIVQYALDRIVQIHEVVQVAFDELDRVNNDETNHVARLLDEIL